MESGSAELESTLATMYRAIVARGNYLSQDRTDIKFEIEELSRGMAKPKQTDWEALIRFAKYLKGREKHVQLFQYRGSTIKESNKFIVKKR